jgi:hypothetical protein
MQSKGIPRTVRRDCCSEMIGFSKEHILYIVVSAVS